MPNHPFANMMRARGLLVVCALLLSPLPARGADGITILTDAFGRDGAIARDWGYSALVEIGGRRILFDAGNDAALFERNVRALKIDLSRLDAVVISHRHGDHTAGLRLVRAMNPGVRIYAAADEHFGGPTPAVFFRPETTLPPEMRYFGGNPPAPVPHGSAWGDLPFVQVSTMTEILPGVRLVPAVSEAPGMRDLREISLVIDTPSGQVVLAGCSHPGIENILRLVTERDPAVRLVLGGLHLVTTAPDEVRRIADALKDRWKVQAIAPGHCTGELAFKAIQERFGKRYLYAGVGTRLDL